MRVTFVLPVANMDGGIRVVSIYADRLRRRGHEVFIASAPRVPTVRQRIRSVLRGGTWRAPSRSVPSHFDGTGLDVHVVRGGRGVKDGDLPDADVVVATWWETAEWVAALSPRKGAKALFLQHHEVFPYLPVDRVEATWRLPIHKIVVSRWLAELARQRYGDDRVSLVPNSVDCGQFHAPPRGKQRVPTVGFVYSTVPFKGCDISLRAYEICARRVAGLRLVAFGARPVDPALPLPAGAEYTCRPPQETLRDQYSRCDAWLLGSREEGFGLPILESMACRTPVVSTPAGAAPELLSGGGGKLVRPEDHEDMARAIEELCTMSEPEWRAVSEKAFEVASSYTWDDATDRFESALHVAVDRGRRGEIGGHGRGSRPSTEARAGSPPR